MLRTTTAAWAGLFLLVGFPLLAGTARAEDKYAGRYVWKGDVEGKFDDGTLTLDPVGQGYAASATEKRKTGGVAWSGSASVTDAALTITRADSVIGFTGALASSGAAATSLEYVVVFDRDTDHATVTVYRKDAAGKATQIGSGELNDHVPFWEKQPGDLLALEEKLAGRVIHKEVDLNKSFSLADYTSLGIRTGGQILKASDETSFMKDADTALRLAGKGDPVWIRTIVGGGPLVSWGHTVPIGSTVSLSAGFGAGATLTYTCDDQHVRPESIDDGALWKKLVEDVAAKGITLPVNADKALSLPEGTRRTLEGHGNLVLSGSAAFGYRLTDLGALQNKVELGANAAVSVHWGIDGDLKLEFERHAGQTVHVRWTRAGSMTWGAEVSALLGLYVSQDLIDRTPAALRQPIKAAVQVGQSYAVVSFNMSREKTDSDTLTIDLELDLSQAGARAAFEGAIVGDFSGVKALAGDQDHGGLSQYRVQDQLVNDLTYSLHFDTFKTLDYDRTSDTSDVEINVTDELTGTKSATEIYSYAKKVSGFFAKLFGGGNRSLSASATDRTVVQANGSSRSGEQIAFTFDQTIDHASHEKIDDELLMAGALFGGESVAHDVEAIHAEQAKKGFEKVKVHLDVTLGTSAIAKILAASDDAFEIAYGVAVSPGETPHAWTPERLALLGKTSLVHDDHATDAQEAQRLEAWDLYYAGQVTKLLDKARASSKDPAKQVAAFRDVMKKEGFKLRALVALVAISGKDDARVAFSMTAKGLAFNHVEGQSAALPNSP